MLFTDGLVERRSSDLDGRLAELAAITCAHPGSADELVDTLVHSMIPEGRPTDDVAVLAVVRSSDPELRLEVPASSNLLAPVRSMVHRWLVDNGTDEMETMELVLAIGELTANVCSHAHVLEEGTMTVRLARDGAQLQLTVADRGRWRAPQDRGGGRGLAIVRSVVDDLQIDHTDGGTTVRITRVLGAPK